ncbi:MAG: hypothetical protein JXA64_03450 [Candidatus Fermentibacteraceae bacterium]|nr:hypothetical protein [Candidatus Fermentibacteraceae bacterium]MBN2608148.1 hypothetical protein [Candidatus Fermentibacteraceae bacterium]
MSAGKQPLWYLFLLLKNRWFLVKALLVVMIPTVVITFLMTKKYTVTSLIMPPEEQSASGLTIAGLGLAEFAGYFGGGMGFSLPLMTTLSDVYEEILNSRSLEESVIFATSFLDSTDLRRMYESDPQQGLYWARKKFRDGYEVSISPTGFLKIEFTFSDPEYAVEVSEAIIAALDSINREITSSRLEQARMFLEQRAMMAESSLAGASEAIRVFEARYGLVAPEEELLGYISNLAQLKAEYAMLMTEISAMRQGISGAPSATLLYNQRKAAELLGVIKMLESGVPAPGYEDIMPSLSLEEYPGISLEYAVLRADYEMSLQITNAVKISLQEAVAAEERQQTHIRVLDPPRHPGWKSRPKKILIWIEVFLITFLALFSFLVARENLRSVKNNSPELWDPWRKLLEDIRKDLSFGRRR